MDGQTLTNPSKMALTQPIFSTPVVEDRLVVKTGSQAKIQVYNLRGEIQFPLIGTSGTHYVEFDFRQKPPGLYIVKVAHRKKQKVYRVFKPG